MTPQATSSPESIRRRPSRRRSAILLALFLATVLSVHFAALASADGRIGASGEDSGGLAQPKGLALSQMKGGDIYVVDGAANQRVAEFHPDGTWVRAFGWGIVPGAAAGNGDLAAGSTSLTNVATTAGRFIRGQIITAPAIPPGTRIEAVTPTELKLTNPATADEPGAALTVAAGPGNLPTNEVQKLTLSATGGEFKLSFTSPNPGSTTASTAAIPASAGAGALQAALAALPNVGSGNVSVSGGPGDAAGTSPYLIEFTGALADANLRTLTATDLGLSGGTPSSAAAVSTPTQGAGSLETCTTVCVGESTEEGGEPGAGSEPGQLRWSDEIAIDNDPASLSYGDVYVVDQRNFRVEKYDSEGHFLLIFGGEVDKTTHADVCTAADIAAGDTCGTGLPGTGPSHFYKEEPTGKSWASGESNSIAVGPGGTVYVGDYGRIQEFGEDGIFAGEFVLPDAEPQFVTALALDPAGNVYERSAIPGGNAQVQSQVPGVREYSPVHTLLRTFDTDEASSEPTHIGLDSSGNVFLSDYNGHGKASYEGQDSSFRAFKPDGTLYAEFTSDQVAQPFARAQGIAIGDTAGKLYATSFNPAPWHVAVIPLPLAGPPAVTQMHVTDIQPTTATLHAVVNPEQFQTEVHFEYTTTDFANCGLPANPSCLTTPTEDLGSVSRDDHVEAAISNLTTKTAYRWRVVAESSAAATAPEAEFETLPPVSVRDFATQTVGPELVTFKAELNPNNGAGPKPGTGAEYTIRYGTDTNYIGGASHGNLPVGSDFTAISATFPGLTPDTTYHYQLTATNSYGNVVTDDATFTTELSAQQEREAESCPNTTLREENSSLALPDCRAYEQVTPTYKAGAEAQPSGLAPSGERVLYQSSGAFAGAVQNEFESIYITERTSAGWVTHPALGSPAGPGYVPGSPGFLLEDWSPELDRTLFIERQGLSAYSAGFSNAIYYLGFADGTFHQASPLFGPVEGEPRQTHYFAFLHGQADDFSRLFILTAARLLPSPGDPRPDDEGSARYGSRIYEIAGADGPDPTISLVAEIPLGLPANLRPGGSVPTGCEINNGEIEGRSSRVVSSNGSTFFYWLPVERAAGLKCGEGTPNPIGLFARIDGAAPIQLNLPPASQCSPSSPCANGVPATPHFDGTSPDGTRAWFTTTQPLVDGDRDETNDIYLAKLENGQLTELVQASAGEASPSHSNPGEGASVKGVTVVSPDGSHISFVALGVLTPHPNALGESAAQGAENLYDYDAASGAIKFVSGLCSGPEESGSVAAPTCSDALSPPFMQNGVERNDINNDAAIWVDVLPVASHSSPARMTPDGRYLLISSWGRLTPDDTDSVPDIYRYDFQSGQLTRVSIGHLGNDANGNDDAFPATVESENLRWQALAQKEDRRRSITSDGSIVIFETSAPLVSRDTNEAKDVYLWQQQGNGACAEPAGCISLISGVDPHGATNGVISASGRDITFSTVAGLAPADTDGVRDVYDARVDGGFHYSPPEEHCHGGDTCPGPILPGPGQPRIGTENEIPPPPKSLHCGNGRRRVKKHGQIRCVAKKHQRTRSHGEHKRTNTNRGGGK